MVGSVERNGSVTRLSSGRGGSLAQRERVGVRENPDIHVGVQEVERRNSLVPAGEVTRTICLN